MANKKGAAMQHLSFLQKKRAAQGRSTNLV
jgi:hypothetical protein